MKPQTWLTVGMFLVGQAAAAGATYAAIRADLREALVRVELHEKRLDRLEDRR